MTAGISEVHAQVPRSMNAAAARTQPVAVLIWQGRVLPIVTDTYASINELGNAIQKDDVMGVSTVAKEFAGELIRFRQVSPVPTSVRPASQLFIKSLADLSNGSATLLEGLGSNSRTELEHASSQIDSGANEFQNAVDKVRRNSGPAGEPTVAAHYAGPTPTPIVRGLP